jgi:hypothetical protein
MPQERRRLQAPAEMQVRIMEPMLRDAVFRPTSAFDRI